MRSYRRRHYFIDKSYQGGVMFRIMLICMLGLVFELGLFNFFAERSYESIRWRIHIDVVSVAEIVRTQLLVSGAVSIILTVLALVIYLNSVIKNTAGPIYRLKKDIDYAVEGDLSREVWLRKEDDFKSTATEINNLMTSVRDDFRKYQQGALEITRLAEILTHVSDKPEKAAQTCAHLIRAVESIKNVRK